MSSKMRLGKAEVKLITNLSALIIDDEEAEQMSVKLSNILDLFAQMEEVNTDGIEPMSHPLEQVQRLRDDIVTETSRRDKYQKIAPATAENLYLVPQVID